jgi:phosphate transport system substrate-binding protein
VALLLVAGAPWGFPARARGAEPVSTRVTFAGSGSNLAIVRTLAEAFSRTHPGIVIDVPSSIGSTGGIRAAAAGRISAGLISRPLREAEQGLGLTVLAYARVVIVIGAHPTVPDDGITSAELVEIYRGTRTRWRDGQEIIVLTREPGDSTIEVLERAVPGFKDAYAQGQRARRWTTLYTDQSMNRALSRTPFAVGFSDLGEIPLERLSIKPLAFDGVPPTAEQALKGRYPLVKTLAFVFKKDTLGPEARAFVDFVRSPEGHRILASLGYLPGD